ELPQRIPSSEGETTAQAARVGPKTPVRAAAGKRHWVFRRASRSSPADHADSSRLETSLRRTAGMVHDALAGHTVDGMPHNLGPPTAPDPGHSTPLWTDGRAPGMTVYVEARLLGPFEFLVNGQPVQHWRGNRGRMLLAYLLLHRGRPLTGDELGGVFWPDAPP